MNQYELIVFDLDNTLAKSKVAINEEMSTLLTKLLEIKKVAVISGGSFKQFEKELLYGLSMYSNFTNLHLFPNDGTAYYVWDTKEGRWNKVYQESLSEKNKIKIENAIMKVISDLGIKSNTTDGKQIEDRDSSITFSALGQNADLDEKEKWDPDTEIRKKIKSALEKEIPEFEITIAGTTSIDVTSKGRDKAYGIKKMVEYIKVPEDKMVFIGDALFVGGNDNPVISTGIKTISVKNPEETVKIIEEIVNNK